MQNNIFLCDHKKTLDTIASEDDNDYLGMTFYSLASPTQANGSTIIYKIK